jgi:hypothetical protein
MFIDTQFSESPEIALIDFCLWGWMKSEVYNTQVVARQSAR